MIRRHALTLGLVLAGMTAACGPDIDLTKALDFKVTESGYFDDGIHDGKTRLLPTITFQITNKSDASISSVVLLVTYHQDGADGELDSVQAEGIGSAGLAPGASTAAAEVRCPHGYTLEGARADFFTNSLYRDVVAKVFARKRAGYMPLGAFKIDRRILEPTARTPGLQ